MKVNEVHLARTVPSVKLPKLGIGTIWFGREWPMPNPAWVLPQRPEVMAHLERAHQAGIKMLDTAPPYGCAEAAIGEIFLEKPEWQTDFFIATKWGEDFKEGAKEGPINHSPEHLALSFQRSLQLLGRIDLLYIHKIKADTLEVLASDEIRKAMQALQASGQIFLTGASISDTAVLETCLTRKLIWPDVLQVRSEVLWNREDLLQEAQNQGLQIVINSPVRCRPKEMGEEEALRLVAANPYVSLVLTGTRNSLPQTLALEIQNIEVELKLRNS